MITKIWGIFVQYVLLKMGTEQINAPNEIVVKP